LATDFKLNMTMPDKPPPSARKLSLHRLAYGMDGVSLSLFGLYPFAGAYFGKQQIMGVAFGITILVLLMCLLTERTVQNRWLPFLLAFILLMIHGLFIPCLK